MKLNASNSRFGHDMDGAPVWTQLAEVALRAQNCDQGADIAL